MKNLFLISAICLVTWLAILFWEAPAEFFFLDKKTQVEALPTADSYMHNTTTRKYDDAGNQVYVLNAETGLYYSADDRFELQMPALTAQKPATGNEPWQLTADIAHSAGQGEELWLSGNVHAWQTVKKGRNEFFTDDIRFSPGNNMATTNAQVKLVHPEGTITGKGMKADFDREVYQLMANVRSYYRAR